ncbi:MAG: O-linked GlcNAc transferase [Candidatus Binatia bacterium]|nr:MAG: O-linked GlcNAc transferase [Candidatus Binatia bacterium]
MGSRGTLALLFVFALAVRLFYVASLPETPFFSHLQTNAARYDLWAKAILSGRGPLPPYEQAPGYPYFVASVYALFGPEPRAVAWVQCFLGALVVVFLAAAARRLFGPGAAVATGVLAALYGPFVYYCAELLPATLFLATVAGGFAASVLAPGRDEGSKPGLWLVSGAAWAAALFVRSNAVLAYPPVFLDALRRGGASAVKAVGLPCLAALLFFPAWNAFRGGEVVWLTTSGGVNLWLGNNPYSDGVSPFVSGRKGEVAEAIREESRTAADADRRFRRLALSFWKEAPGRALLLAGKKFLWTWTARELPNNADIEWRREKSPLFAGYLFPFHMGYLVPLAAAALFVLPFGRFAWALSAPAFLGLGTCLVFFTNARFRLPLALPLLVLAGGFLSALPRLRTLPRGSLLGTLAGFSAGAVLSWGNFFGVWDYRIPEIVANTGILERKTGHPDRAIGHLEEAVRLDPTDGIAWVHLALAFEETGRPRDALRAFLDGIASNPGDRQLAAMAVLFFHRNGLPRGELLAYVAEPTGERRRRLLGLLGEP